MMSKNLIHKLTNESLFVGFATIALFLVALMANTLFWPAVVLVFGLRAIHDLNKVLSNRSVTPVGKHELAASY